MSGRPDVRGRLHAKRVQQRRRNVVGVYRQVLGRERRRRAPRGLCQYVTRSDVKGEPPAQVGKGKSHLAISSVRGTDEIEEDFVLADAQKLTVALHPSASVPRDTLPHREFKSLLTKAQSWIAKSPKKTRISP